MIKTDLERKIEENFGEMSLYKNLNESKFFQDIRLPSFMRDFVLKKFQNSEGGYDAGRVKEFVRRFLPGKDEWESLKSRLVIDKEIVRILAKVTVYVDIATEKPHFELPEYGLGAKDTIIPLDVWERVKDKLLSSVETWGVIDLFAKNNDANGSKGGTKIALKDFKEFVPYKIDLEAYKDARKNFTLHEWIDVMMSAVDYNPKGYSNVEEKLTLLTRVLPFVENRVNLIELAPKGTGKSYLYGNVSPYGWLSSGGTLSRAKIFYDLSKRREGLICTSDFLVFDEIQTMDFKNMDEIRGILKEYLESGKLLVGNWQSRSECGLVLSGNVSDKTMKEDGRTSMFHDLPELIRESALLDRFHGIIKGWNIPRMNNSMKCNGVALNSEYVSSIFHLLRYDISYRRIVEEAIDIPPQSDTRDTEAIVRLSTAYMKLLFPHIREASEMSDAELSDFDAYCLSRAKRMRALVRRQLEFLDDEYAGKALPEIKIRQELFCKNGK